MDDRRTAASMELRARLAEPHRVYHGQAHVDALLADLAARRGTFHDPEAVELAVWFHDAVYAPGAPDNERRSAALLRAAMDGLVPGPTLALAEAMVLATERHALPPGLPAPLAADVAAFLDMDMAVLGAEPAAYDRYARGVPARRAGRGDAAVPHGSGARDIGRAGAGQHEAGAERPRVTGAGPVSR